MHLYQLIVRVRDMNRSIRFYETFIGLKMQRRVSYGEVELAFLANEDDATIIELVSLPAGDKAEAKGLTIVFHADDLDAVRERALAWDLNPSDIRDPDPENRYFYVYDPDGLSIEFKQKLH
jgi:lactoylglutathione lyase